VTADGADVLDDTPVAIIRPIDVDTPPRRRPTGRRHLDRRARRLERTPAQRNVRRAVRALLLVAVALLGYFLITLFQVWSTGRNDQARAVDAIVVMGAAQYDGDPSPQLAARLDHVVELWPQGLASLVVVTGGNQPGDRFTEAEASASYLVQRGVPADVILLEDGGRTSYESLQGVAGLLAERDLRSVLVVTDPYHSLRSRLIAQDVGLTAYASPTTTSVVTGGESYGRHLREAAGISIGRLIGFEDL